MSAGPGEDCVHGLYRPGIGFERIAYYFYLSKYVEFADTVFLLVTNKEVITLHYFHHLFAAFGMSFDLYTSMFCLLLDMWILHVAQHDSIWIFVFFNSAIHTFMYFYYGMDFNRFLLIDLMLSCFFNGSAIWKFKNRVDRIANSSTVFWNSFVLLAYSKPGVPQEKSYVDDLFFYQVSSPLYFRFLLRLLANPLV
jgi:hypothetical protein